MLRTDKRKLAVLNWAGHGNLGDELFNDAYRQLFPDWDIIFFSNSKDATYPMIDYDIVNQYDLFALGGGELINSDRLFIPSYWTDKIKPNIPKIILGCGINANKYSELKSNVLRELENFRYIGLRDYASLKILSESVVSKRIGLFYDLAFSVDYPQIEQEESNERIVVVIPTDRFSNKSDRGILQYNVAKKSQKWLKKHIMPFDKVVFLAFGKEDNDDYKTCKQLAKVIPNNSTIITDKQAMLNAIASASSIYTYRLHGLILAKIFGKPCGYYPYHRKLNRMSDTLLGCSPDLIRLWQRKTVDNILEAM